MKSTKIKSLEVHTNAMELSKIHFNNGMSIKVLDYLKTNGIPCDIQKAMLAKNYAECIKLIRKYNKNYATKGVKISYTCNVFSTVTNSWHEINEENYACGSYNNVSDIKKVIDKKRNSNKESIQKGLIEKLKFSYSFLF